MTKAAKAPESYDCQACGAAVVVGKSGRWWSAERGQWLCVKCFGEGRPTEAETNAKLNAMWRRNRGLPEESA